MLELMVVVLIISIVAITAMPLLRKQIAMREIDFVARKFIAHAQFARQQALHLGVTVQINPNFEKGWSGGWVVTTACSKQSAKFSCDGKAWLSQGAIDPIFFKGGGKQWIDPHTGKPGILFNPAGAAKTGQGGFVANRLILGHRHAPDLERQLILGSGGRWRICNPVNDAKRCH